MTKSTDSIDNSRDLIDSRDVIARIEYLQDERARLEEATEEEGITDDVKAAHEVELKEYDESEDGQELKALLDLADEAEGYASDWQYGEVLIRESYFEKYAQEVAEDIGAIPDNAQWPCTCIDWEQAADELKQDYTAVEFDGITYYVR